MAETTGLLRENYKNKWVSSSDSTHTKKNGSLLIFFDCLLISHDRAPCGTPLTNFTKACLLFCKLVKQSPACDLPNGAFYPTVIYYYFKRSRCFLILLSNDWTSWSSFIDITVYNPIGVRKNSCCVAGPQVSIRH